MNGTMTTGCIDPTHSPRRSTKNRFVYGGGSAASLRLAACPQIPTGHIARPTIIPSPIEESIGPSERSTGAIENRAVRMWNPNTASSTTPNSTHDVGWVNAAAMPIRKSADLAPQDVLAAWRNGSVSDNRNSTVMLSR